MPDREPKFQVGDLVQHRASKEVALVVAIPEGCTTQHERFQFFCGPDCKRGFCGSYTLARTFGDSFSAHEGCLELVTRLPEPPPNRDTTDGKLPVEGQVPPPEPEPPSVTRYREGSVPPPPPPKASLPNYPPLSADDCESILYQAASVVVRCAISAEHLLPWIRLAGNMQDRGVRADIAGRLLGSVLACEREMPQKPEPPPNVVTREGSLPAPRPPELPYPPPPMPPPPDCDVESGK